MTHNEFNPTNEGLQYSWPIDPDEGLEFASDEWFAVMNLRWAEARAKDAEERTANPGPSLHELDRMRKERHDKQKKIQDLTDQAVRLAKRCRLGRKVTPAVLAGKTENQLRLIVRGLQAQADTRAREEMDRLTPDQRVADCKRLKHRQILHQRHLESKRPQPAATDSDQWDIDAIWKD